MLWGQRVGAGAAASLFAALMAGSLAGCNLLKPKKAYGESCTLGTDCASLDCVAQGSVCTKDCLYDRECGDGWVCRQKTDGPGDHCAKPVGAIPNGTCMDSNDCQHGHCLKRTGEDMMPGICSKFCANPDECPAGMKICDLINDTAVNKMCLPGDAAAPATQRPKFSQPVVKQPVVGGPAFQPRPIATPAPTPTPVPTPTVAAPQPTPTTGPAIAPRTSLTIKPRTPAPAKK